jgi:hypothetical protein
MKAQFSYMWGKLRVVILQVGEELSAKEFNARAQEIDLDSLSEGQLELYHEYKAAYKLMKDAKAEFENSIRATLGMEAKTKTSKASKSAVSLASFLAAQANGGRHV